MRKHAETRHSVKYKDGKGGRQSPHRTILVRVDPEHHNMFQDLAYRFDMNYGRTIENMIEKLHKKLKPAVRPRRGRRES